MKKSMLLAGAAMLLTAATPALAQSTISPGMTTEQVRDRFGAPATTRAQGDWSYWYYHNGCPVRCGSDDVVFFQNDRVVAAVLRTARRRFAGPAADDALGAATDATIPAPDPRETVVPASDAPEGRARVGGVRVDGAPTSGLMTTPAPATGPNRPLTTPAPATGPDRPLTTPAPATGPNRPRPVAREGQPGEPSTIVITQPDPVTAERVTPPAPATGPNRPRPVAREGQPGEPSTIVITQPDPAPAVRVTPPVPVNRAREGQAGEPSTIVITTPPAELAPATAPDPAAGTNPPAVDGPLPATPPAGADAPQPANPAENTEAADTRGETSIDRKTRRVRQDRRNEATATERARRNDAKNP